MSECGEPNYRVPCLFQQQFAPISNVTVNRGETLTVWVNASECFLWDGRTEYHEKHGHPIRLQIAVELDGTVRVTSRLGETEYVDEKTKLIDYRGGGRAEKTEQY